MIPQVAISSNCFPTTESKKPDFIFFYRTFLIITVAKHPETMTTGEINHADRIYH